MALTQSYTTDATLETIKSKAPVFFKGASDLTLRKRMVMALMRKWGGMIFNADLSWVRVWNVKTKLPTVSTWVDSGDYLFASNDAEEQFSIGDGSYLGTDRMSEMDYERLKGSRTQISDRYTEKSKDLAQAMENHVCSEFLHGTGSARRMAGMDAFLSNDGAHTAADIVKRPSATYAGQSTVPGTNGTWAATLSPYPNATIASDWPQNTGSSDYDAKTPLLLHRDSLTWQAGTLWSNNCEEQLRYYLSVQGHRGGIVKDRKAAHTLLMGEQSKRELLTYFSARNTIPQPVKEAMDLGFPETLYFEGAWLVDDYNVSANEIYCIQPDMMEFYTCYSDLYKVNGPTYRPDEFDFIYAVRMLGNFRFQPKFFGHIAN